MGGNSSKKGDETVPSSNINNPKNQTNKVSDTSKLSGTSAEAGDNRVSMTTHSDTNVKVTFFFSFSDSRFKPDRSGRACNEAIII